MMYSSIYGNSDTVQPNSVKYRAFIQLASATTDSALQTVNSIVSDVNDLQDAMEETVNYKNITNCITEIPQDIKVEYNNSTITLKAGSKVYVPDGFETDGTSFKYNIITVTNDISRNVSGSGAPFLYLKNDGSLIIDSVYNSSGSSAPIGSEIWYDTTNNLIKMYTSGVDSGQRYSLPICILTKDNGTITSIDQVFNGFGYIGSIVFSLPGVKCLIPNGRNADGSLKNYELTTSSVNFIDAYQTYYFINTNSNLSPAYYTNYAEQEEKPSFTNGFWYKPSENKIYRIISGNVSNQETMAYAFNVYVSTGNKVKEISSAKTFRALDYNSKTIISEWSLPSNKYVDLTLGANSESYTAPANGYFTLFKAGTDAQQYIYIFNKTTGNCMQSVRGNGGCAAVFLPARRGDVVQIDYSMGGATQWFRFVYAEGEVV